MPAPPGSVKLKRRREMGRTQAQRRADTRGRLLDAAVDAVVEMGYARTTLAEVQRRAGLSNGAMWLHFPTKEELLVAAWQHAENSAATSYPAPDQFAALDPPRRLDAVLEQLWTETRNSAFHLQIELVRASRGDPRLRAALERIDPAVAQEFQVRLQSLLGSPLRDHPQFKTNLRIIVHQLYGTALIEGSLSARVDTQRDLEDLKLLGRLLFNTASPRGGRT
jgi:AcrR family transcriptional regulator